MITAADTNVLLDVLGADPTYGAPSAEALRLCLKEGQLVACDVVWAETASFFDSQAAARDALANLGLEFSPLTHEAARAAAAAWRAHRAKGGKRGRVAADFLIGAHARLCTDRLLARDRGFYRTYFSGLKVLKPSRG